MRSTKALCMFRLGFLSLCLILVSLTTATAIHARELGGAVDIECSGYVHSQGDSDESSGDADGTVPHHHGNCHGVAAFLPMRDFAAHSVPLPALASPRPEAQTLDRWISGPDLRPPIAA